jgi:hypothetical protein
MPLEASEMEKPMKIIRMSGILTVAVVIAGCVGSQPEDEEPMDDIEASESAWEVATSTDDPDYAVAADPPSALKQCWIQGTCGNGTPYWAALGSHNSCPSYAYSYAQSLCGYGGVKTFKCVCQ